MLVKGKLVGSCSKVAPEVQVEVSEEALKEKGWYNHGYSPVVPQEKVDKIRQEYLEELLEATIKVAVKSEYLDVLDDADEWNDYVNMMLSDPEQLFKDFAEGHIHEMIEETAEEIYEKNKPKYYSVDVRLVVDCHFYVKAQTEDEVDDLLTYDICADEIMDACDAGNVEIENCYINGTVSEDDIRYEAVYDKDEGYFI